LVITGIDPRAPALPVQHQAAADECADEEIEEIAVSPALAEKEFGGAGGRRVVAQHDGIGTDVGDLPLSVEVAPRRHGPGRGADLDLPGPQLKR